MSDGQNRDIKSQFPYEKKLTRRKASVVGKADSCKQFKVKGALA